MLFIDQPVGTGFSTAHKVVTSEEEVAEDMVSFMHSFYEFHPDMTAENFIIAGGSYCGRYIPHIANAIIKEGEIPLKAIVLGNALIDVITQRSHIGDLPKAAGYITSDLLPQYALLE
jgi:cathepsin A (carboxypeptidase C)